jgi:hypothetical protein
MKRKAAKQRLNFAMPEQTSQSQPKKARWTTRDKRLHCLGSEQVLILDRNLANLRAAVIVLQAIAALQMSPDDPTEAAKQLRNLENKLFESDPKSQERKEVAGIIEAVKLLKKRGGGRQNDS